MKSNEFMLGYISGMIDGEGGVYSYMRKNRQGTLTWHSHRLSIANTDKDIIERLVSFLQVFGFQPRVVNHRPKNNTKYKICYTVDLRSNDFEKANKLFSLAAKKKAMKLQRISSLIASRPRNKIPSIEILIREYETLSCGALAKKYNVSREFIRRKLIGKVSMRKPSENYKNLIRGSKGRFTVS